MNSLSKIKNKELLEHFSVIVSKEKMAIADVVAYVAELYQRRLYLEEGYSSLFSFLTEKYGYSGSAAYRRIQSAKISLLFPTVVELLRSGKINLMTLSLVEPHVTKENGENILQEVIGKNKEDVEYYLSNHFFIKERVQDKIRRLPVIKKEFNPCHSGSAEEGEGTEAICTSPKESSNQDLGLRLDLCEKDDLERRRVKIEFVADEGVATKIERSKELLRRKYPQGKLEDIVNEALDALLEKKDPERKILRIGLKERKASTPMKEGKHEQKSQVSSRYISQGLRRAIWRRDKGQCTFQSKDGKYCHETRMLEIDHIEPYSLGGKTEAQNLRLLCAAHNQVRSHKTFGFIQDRK